MRLRVVERGKAAVDRLGLKSSQRGAASLPRKAAFSRASRGVYAM